MLSISAMTEKTSHVETANGQRDCFIFVGKVVCLSENAQKDLHDVLETNVFDVKDLEKVVQYCIDHQKITTVLYHLPIVLWSELSRESLVELYNALETKKIALGNIQKGLDNLDAPRHEQLKILISSKK